MSFSYFVLNKPPGCITGRSDPGARPTVYEHVPPHFPAVPHVGRLDYNTEGLLLFTDDGALARALLDPADGPHVEKVYEAKVRPQMARDDPRIAAIEAPYLYEDGVTTRPARARHLWDRARSSWVEVVIVEGRHHQVRNLLARSGLQVVKLRRTRFGPLGLGDLKLRWCRALDADEIAALYAAADLPLPVSAGGAR